MARKRSKYDTFANRLIAATPILVTMAYLLIGFQFDLWHPGWVIFILIPLMPALLKPRTAVRGLFPLIVAATYLLMGFIWGLWHPGWIIFMIIPVFYIMFPEGKKKRIIAFDVEDEEDDQI